MSAPVARQFLERLTPEERWSLLKYAGEGLQNWLLAAYRDAQLQAEPGLQAAIYPELPKPLLDRLKDWEAKNRRRLESRIKNGHARAPGTLRRLMAEPIALARFIADRGVDRWEKMNMSDRIAFARTRPKRTQQKLKAFITFIEGGNPFKTRRGRPPKSAQKVIRETPQIPVLAPDDLKARLRDARQRLPAEQYLIYWLVAKLGLTAKVAYGLTLDKVTINSKGRVVIRPAEAWFALPASIATTMEKLARDAEQYLIYWLVAKLGLTAKVAYGLTLDKVTINSKGRVVIRPAEAWFALPASIATTMEKLARDADAQWPYESPNDAAAIPIFAPVIPRHRVGPEIFRGETTLLRSSAIHSAMHYGHLDRKTLASITGVSLKTISDMEFLVPADIHSLVSHKLVAQRNRAILGSDDD